MWLFKNPTCWLCLLPLFIRVQSKINKEQSDNLFLFQVAQNGIIHVGVQNRTDLCKWIVIWSLYREQSDCLTCCLIKVLKCKIKMYSLISHVWLLNSHLLMTTVCRLSVQYNHKWLWTKLQNCLIYLKKKIDKDINWSERLTFWQTIITVIMTTWKIYAWIGIIRPFVNINVSH